MTAALRTAWQAQPPRQRALVTAAALLLLGVGLWQVIAPAWATLRSAPQQQAAWATELQRLQGLEAQARALQALPRAGRDDARRALEASVQQHLGASARLQTAGDGATLTLTGARGDALAQWLAQARIDARARPTEARLTRNAAGLWDGTLVLALPTR